MEKQWQTDEGNPDYPYVRNAWRRNIASLWDRIWQKLNSKKSSASSYIQDLSSVAPGMYGSIGSTTHSARETGLADNVSFPATDPIEDDFLYSSNKPSSVEGLGTYPPVIDLLQVQPKRKSGTKRVSSEIPPFPDDLRHFRYLPVWLW